MANFTSREIAAYVAAHGCFCGGRGSYTDYNCGASFELTCPHCAGTGQKICACTRPAIKCGGK